MFPPHPSPAQPDMNHFYNNPGLQNNPGMYGRHTPHIAPNSTFLPSGPLPGHNGPPPPHMMSGWNGGFHMPPPPPTPQTPYNPVPHHHNHHRPPPMPQQLPQNMMNFQPNRHQFNLGNPPFQCPPPPQPTFGPPPSSQFMMPLSQFPGGPDTFHQGYVTAGGPFSAHHNNGPFYAPHDHRNMTNFMGPPPPFMPVNNHPPMPLPQQGAPYEHFHLQKPDLSQSGFNDICGHYGITPVTFPKALFGKIVNDETVKNTVFSSMDDNDLQGGMLGHLQPHQTNNDLLNTNTSRGEQSQNTVRMTTPSSCILERNTAVNFDESSEELAEIFGDKATSSTTTTKSRSSSKASSSSSTFNSDDENCQSSSKEKPLRAVKPFTKSSCQVEGAKDAQGKQSEGSSEHSESSDHIKPPPGFAHIKPSPAPTDDNLSKAGHIIKGMLKIEVKKGNRGSSTSPHEGNTIRSMIHQPIYSNCESRLVKQEPEVRLNETQSGLAQVLNSANTGQTRYIQRITTHFRILFEPIPDMFEDN